ncbi:hypothetical protein KC354_g76 [Hortaea werneckii]|nr:hypothetical protein KC354_g76 [Hortaea werneckii]
MYIHVSFARQPRFLIGQFKRCCLFHYLTPRKRFRHNSKPYAMTGDQNVGSRRSSSSSHDKQNRCQKKRIRNWTASDRAKHRAFEKERREAFGDRLTALARFLPALADTKESKLSKHIVVEESLKFHRSQHEKIEALQSSIDSLFTERDALLSELNEWRQCLCMPPRQASMIKDHLKIRVELYGLRNFNSTMPTQRLYHATIILIRQQMACSRSLIWRRAARSRPSTMGCSMQFNETGPAPYGSIANPTESGNHEFYNLFEPCFDFSLAFQQPTRKEFQRICQPLFRDGISIDGSL